MCSARSKHSLPAPLRGVAGQVCQESVWFQRTGWVGLGRKGAESQEMEVKKPDASGLQRHTQRLSIESRLPVPQQSNSQLKMTLGREREGGARLGPERQGGRTWKLCLILFPLLSVCLSVTPAPASQQASQHPLHSAFSCMIEPL